MGKIRVKTIGDEEKDNKAKEKEEARLKAIAEAKARAGVKEEPAEEAVEEPETNETETTEVEAPAKKADKTKAVVAKSKKQSASYAKAASAVEKFKKYSLTEALEILPKLQRAKFDETVELHINTLEKGISGNVVLPHGTGKETRVAIANATDDAKAVDELVKTIESGKVDFDVLIATPDAMPKLARVARVLGPRGLMPNPKNGTVSPKPEEVAKKFAGGQINFKTEAKFPILHMAVGKVSFGDKKLSENIKTAIAAVKVKNIKNVTLKSTMSPGMKLETASL